MTTITAGVLEAAARVREAEDALIRARLDLCSAWADRSAALVKAGYSIEYSNHVVGVPQSLRQVVLDDRGHTLDLDALAP